MFEHKAISEKMDLANSAAGAALRSEATLALAGIAVAHSASEARKCISDPTITCVVLEYVTPPTPVEQDRISQALRNFHSTNNSPGFKAFAAPGEANTGPSLIASYLGLSGAERNIFSAYAQKIAEAYTEIAGECRLKQVAAAFPAWPDFKPNDGMLTYVPHSHPANPADWLNAGFKRPEFYIDVQIDGPGLGVFGPRGDYDSREQTVKDVILSELSVGTLPASTAEFARFFAGCAERAGMGSQGPIHFSPYQPVLMRYDTDGGTPGTIHQSAIAPDAFVNLIVSGGAPTTSGI